MRVILLFLMSASLAFAAGLPSPKQKIWEPPFYNGTAVQVDKILITYDDIRREMAPIVSQVRQQATSPQDYENKMQTLYEQTLNGLIERALLVSEFNAKGYKVPPKDADLEYKRILKESFDGKVSDLIASLQQQGLTLTSYRQRLTENMMVSALQSRFRSELPAITPQQVEAYYQGHLNKFSQSGSVKLAVITLKPMTAEPLNVLKQTALDVVKKAKSGEDFNELALSYNEEGSVNWDWVDNDDLLEPVREAIANLKIDDISEPIQIEGPKFLVVKLIDRKNEGSTGLSDVQEDIKRTLFEEQAQKAYSEWMAQLRKKYFVKINS